MLDRLTKIVQSVKDAEYCEARYQKRSEQRFTVSKGELDDASAAVIEGASFRVIVNGAWGFSSTDKLTTEGLAKALSDAISSARATYSAKKKVSLAAAELAGGKFAPPIRGPLRDVSIEAKIGLVKEAEAEARKHHQAVKSASSSYREILDYKVIVTSDGASAEVEDSKPEFRVFAVVQEGGEMITASESLGVTGGWGDLFAKKDGLTMAHVAAEKAVKLASAKHPGGERITMIFDPAMVGLLCHEAIGHTVEADFVLAGSVAKDSLGKKVASEGVTLVDSGSSLLAQGAAGTVLVDDEGVLGSRTVIIEKGFLKSYLHSRESAAAFGVEATGNARAYEYHDQPLIRMRNTYIEPGDWGFEEMVKDTKRGYLLKGARSGQADANGEFMFGAQEAYLVEHGEVKDLFRGVTVSGQAYDVLMSVDAVGKDFAFDLGSGYCGKWQPAKVDGGGPHLRCQAILGGKQ